MEISRVCIRVVRIPLVKPYKVAFGTVTHGQNVIVKVHTAGGLVGYGEADPLPPFTSETVESVVQVLRHVLCPLLIGRDALDRNAVLRAMDAAVAGNLMAKGAIDIALWDLAGKHCGVPVHRLLGGPVHASLRLLWPLPSQTPQADASEIEAKMADGYRTFMLKMGAGQDVAAEAERVRSAAKFFDQSEDFRLCVDPNQGWDATQCLRFLRTLDLGGPSAPRLDFIEQPLPRTASPSAFQHIRSRTCIPISLDESIMTVSECRDALANGMADIIALKVSKNGGITPSLRIASLCGAFDTRVLCNSMLEFGITQAATLNIAVTLPHLADCGHCFMSTLRFTDDVTDFASLVAADKTVRPPSAPGLGVRVDDAKLERLSSQSFDIAAHDLGA